MIHAKQWHYSLQQRLPVASFHSFYTKKSKGFFEYQFYIQKTKSSSSNSTCRRQGDLLSSLQRPTSHSRHSSHKTFHRHSSSTRTFQSFMTFQTFQSFMTFQPYRHLYTFQHLPVQSSTFQCYPVYPGIPPVPAFLQLECKFYTPIGFHQKLHRVPVKDNTDIPQTFILQRKGDVAIWVRMTLSVK